MGYPVKAALFYIKKSSFLLRHPPNMFLKITLIVSNFIIFSILLVVIGIK